MSWATLMVHMELGRSNAGLLKVAAELAERFGSGVGGIAARQPMQMMKAVEAEFRSALEGRVAFVELRSAEWSNRRLLSRSSS